MNHNITINNYENNTLLFKETTTGILDEDYLTFSTDTDSVRLNLDKFNFISYFSVDIFIYIYYYLNTKYGI